MPRPLFTPGKDPVPIVQEAGWAPGPVWTGAENLAPTGIRSPDCPARSQSLYRLRYPAHFPVRKTHKIKFGARFCGRRRLRNAESMCGRILERHLISAARTNGLGVTCLLTKIAYWNR